MNASYHTTTTTAFERAHGERGPRAHGPWVFNHAPLSPLFTRRGSARYTYR